MEYATQRVIDEEFRNVRSEVTELEGHNCSSFTLRFLASWSIAFSHCFLVNRHFVSTLSVFNMAGSSLNSTPPTVTEKKYPEEHSAAEEKIIDQSREKFIAMGIWSWVKVNFTVKQMQEYWDMIEEVQYSERHLMIKYGGKFHRIFNVELARKIGMTVRMPHDWESLDLPTEPLELEELFDALNLEETEAKLARFQSQGHIPYGEILDQ